MANKEEKMKSATEVLRKYLEKEDVYDYLSFVNRFDETSGRYSGLDGWVKFAKKVLTDEEYQRFYFKVYPLDKENSETEELKEHLIDIARRISRGKANMYDVFDELNISMHQYIYLLKQVTYRHKLLNASCYRSNADYYNTISGYLKPSELTSSFPTLGKEMHNAMVKFVEEHNLPLNNFTYNEAYKAFEIRGLIKFPQVKK